MNTLLLRSLRVIRRFIGPSLRSRFSDDVIYKHFRGVLMRRYISVSEWRKKWRDDKVKPKCVPDEVWKRWLVVFDSAEYQKRSERNMKNRMSEPDGPGTGVSRVAGGSRSGVKYALDIAEELGRPAMALERRASTQEEPDVDEVYLSVATKKKKKKIFGTGALAKVFSSSSFSFSVSSSGSSELEERIRQTLREEFERKQKETEERLAKERIAARAADRAQLEEGFRASIKEMEQRLRDELLGRPPPHP